MTEKQRAMTVCLSDIDGFESITARMPTKDEREQGFPPGVPVVIVRKHGLAGDLIYRADLTEFTIDSTPAPDPQKTREATRHVLNHVIERLASQTDDLVRLARALKDRPRAVVELGEELHRETWTTERALALLEKHTAAEGE